MLCISMVLKKLKMLGRLSSIRTHAGVILLLMGTVILWGTHGNNLSFYIVNICFLLFSLRIFMKMDIVLYFMDYKLSFFFSGTCCDFQGNLYKAIKVKHKARTLGLVMNEKRQMSMF